MQIQRFIIMSERCTGSHFVQYAMLENFFIEYSRRHHHLRHFFGHENDMASYTEEEKQTMLMICVVRNPVEWVDSFFKRKHHVPPENRHDIERFLKREWYSIYEQGDKKGQEIMEDRHFLTKKRYPHLLALRETKHDYFLYLEKALHLFPHVLILKYEDLRDDYENTLESIQTRFQLRRKHPHEWKKIVRYKGTYHALYEKKPILLSPEIQDYIWAHVNLEQEKTMGYTHEGKKK